MTLAFQGKSRRHIAVLATLSFLGLVLAALAGALLLSGRPAGAADGPDLTATKAAYLPNGTGPVSEVPVDETFIWRITLANEGTANAVFAYGHVVFRDHLPTGPGYALPADPYRFNLSDVGGTGTIRCFLESPPVVRCEALAIQSSTFPAGASIDIDVLVTPGELGTLVNPRSGANLYCRADPGSELDEADETNNDCADTVTVVEAAPAPVALEIENSGSGAFDREYQWTLNKSVALDPDDPTYQDEVELDLMDGESQELRYRLAYTRTLIESNYRAMGTITISNSASNPPAIINSVSDDTATVSGCYLNGAGGPVSFAGGYALSGGDELVCEWTVEGLEDATPFTTTAFVTTSPDSPVDGGSAQALVDAFSYSGIAQGPSSVSLTDQVDGEDERVVANADGTGSTTFITELSCDGITDWDGASGVGTYEYRNTGRLRDQGSPIATDSATVVVDCQRPRLTLELEATGGDPSPPLPGDWTLAAQEVAPGDAAISGVPGISAFVPGGTLFDLSLATRPPAYRLTTVSCEEDDSGAAVAVPLTMPSADVTCTFAASYEPAIVILKSVFSPVAGGEEVDLTITQHSPVPLDSTAGRRGHDAQIVREGSPGVFSVAIAGAGETELAFYDTALTCTSSDTGRDDLPDAAPVTTSLQFPVAHDETVTCTFANTARLGSLAITKDVAWGETLLPSPTPDPAFTICIEGPSFPGPTLANGGCVELRDGDEYAWEDIFAGTYLVTETAVDSGALAWWDSTGAGVVAVATGTEVVREITNTFRSGALSITKVVDWNGFDETDESFTICLTGPSYPLPGALPADPGAGDFASGACKAFSPADTRTWDNLYPGPYQVVELNAGSAWLVSYADSSPTVSAGGTASTTVTNRRLRGELTVGKTLSLQGGTLPEGVSFEACLSGPDDPGSLVSCEPVSPNAPAIWDKLAPGEYRVEERILPSHYANQFATTYSAQQVAISCNASGCTAEPSAVTITNELQRSTLTVDLVMAPGATPSAGDWPTVRVSDLGSDEVLCELTSSDGDYESCDVPGNSAIRVEEQLSTGWRFASFGRAGACSLPEPTLEAQVLRIVVSPTAALLNLETLALDGLPGGDVEIPAAGSCTVTFTNEPVGSVELIRQSTLSTTAAQDWPFGSAILGDPVITMPPNPDGSVVREHLHFPEVALGEHSISSLLGGATCTAESVATDYQTVAAASTGSEPSVEDLELLGDAPMAFVVEHARLTTIVFVAEPCGDVLQSAPLSIRVLESEAGDFAGDAPLPAWEVSLDGTAGMAAGMSDARSTDHAGEVHFGSVAPGIYTICSHPDSTHRAVGSVANDGQGEVEGACRDKVSVVGEPGREEGVVANFFYEPLSRPATPPASATGSPGHGASATPTPRAVAPSLPSATVPLPVASSTAAPPAPSPGASVTVVPTATVDAPNPLSPTAAPPHMSTPDGSATGDSSPAPSPGLTTTPADAPAGAATPGTATLASSVSPTPDASPTPIAPDTGTGGPSLSVSRALTMAALSIILLGGGALVFLYGSESSRRSCAPRSGDEN